MKITEIAIIQHRLAFAPPFRASWGSRPRHHWDATIVRVRTDEGLTGIGSGDLMLGSAGHEHLFVGQDPMAIERHYRSISLSTPTDRLKSFLGNEVPGCAQFQRSGQARGMRATPRADPQPPPGRMALPQQTR